MGITDRDLVQIPGGGFPAHATELIVIHMSGTIAQGLTDQEQASVRIPYDCQILESDCYVWARSIGGGSPTVELQDDGTDISTPATVAAGVQTLIPGIAAGTRVKAGSELQVMVDTSGASETIVDGVVTIAVRPYPLGEAGVAVT